MALLLVALYTGTHIWQLTALPVFADEAIYIRWSQLILDDWRRYAFFALNDGKTPLQFWLMAPLQLVFSDRLFAARMLSVLVGAAQVATIGSITKELGGKSKTVWLSMLLTIVLPFWYFHHRMVLLDGMLTLWLSLSWLGVIKLVQTRSTTWTILSGLFFGLALLTKVPAILFGPVLLLWWLYGDLNNRQHAIEAAIRLGCSLLLGIAIFGSLKLTPVFGQLFARGGDFLYPVKEVLFQGAWQHTLGNIPNYVHYFASYLTTPVLLLATAGLFSTKQRRTLHLLFWSAIMFIAPIAVLGKVVYPRYLLPASMFFTVGAALSLQNYVITWIQDEKRMLQKTIASIALVGLVAQSLGMSATFITQSLTQPNETPFVSADAVQYLEEWSSGHGIAETTTYIREQAQDHTVAVATEGYFGTLPDGILLYLHRQDVSNIYVEGIGQPVSEIPSSFVERARSFDQVLLVVNSHRNKLALDQETLLREYCRPNQAPCLQVWDITKLLVSETQPPDAMSAL